MSPSSVCVKVNALPAEVLRDAPASMSTLRVRLPDADRDCSEVIGPLHRYQPVPVPVSKQPGSEER